MKNPKNYNAHLHIRGMYVKPAAPDDWRHGPWRAGEENEKMEKKYQIDEELRTEAEDIYNSLQHEIDFARPGKKVEDFPDSFIIEYGRIILMLQQMTMDTEKEFDIDTADGLTAFFRSITFRAYMLGIQAASSGEKKFDDFAENINTGNLPN